MGDLTTLDNRLGVLIEAIENGSPVDLVRQSRLMALEAVRAQLDYLQDAVARTEAEDENLAEQQAAA